MAITVAYDASGVEDRTGVAEDEQVGGRPVDHLLDRLRPSHSVTDQGGNVPQLAAWPGQRLNAALAELGPIRPGTSDGDRSWPRVIATAEFVPNGQHLEPSELEPEPANGNSDGLHAAVDKHELPPPPLARPSRQMPILTEEPPSRPAILDMAHDARLAETDAAGGEIVRLIASANIAQPDAARSLDPTTVADVDPMDSPPMIIERARVEQELGLLKGMPGLARLNPVPGLLTGFAFSLVAGAVLYAVLTTN